MTYASLIYNASLYFRESLFDISPFSQAFRPQYATPPRLELISTMHAKQLRLYQCRHISPSLTPKMIRISIIFRAFRI